MQRKIGLLRLMNFDALPTPRAMSVVLAHVTRVKRRSIESRLTVAQSPRSFSPSNDAILWQIYEITDVIFLIQCF